MMQQFGVIGLSVMGKNLALNIRNHRFSVAGFSIDKPEVDALAKYEDDKLKPTYSWEEFINSLEKPRKMLIMIRAGKPVDMTLEKLTELLEPGDIVIDGGNSNFNDTNRRFKKLEEKGIHFIGMGVSGGEEGALNGPALMPGGDKEAYDKVSPILESIAAKTEEGVPCVAYIGPEASGHYVKMVHNGMEYGIMQIICEVYDVLRTVGNCTNEQMSEIFAKWDEGQLHSYLTEITSKVLKQRDDLADGYIVDKILNVASYKGTGNWMLEDAIKLGCPITVIAEAVLARFASKATLRDGCMPEFKGKVDLNQLITKLANAYYLASAVSYAQGFQQLSMAAKEYGWNLHYPAIAQTWEAGCIIRSSMLKDIENAFNQDADLPNLFKDKYFNDIANKYTTDLEEIVKLAVEAGIPIPTLGAAYSYLKTIFNPKLPQNLLQGQRDYFGAHTYYRNDRDGVYHMEWYTEK